MNHPPCLWPRDGMYQLGPCNGDAYSVTTTIPGWDPSKMNVSCQVTNSSWLNHTEAVIACPYISWESLWGKLMVSLASFVMLVLVGLAVGTAWLRNQKAVRSSDWIWSLVRALGCMLATTSVYSNVGPRTNVMCSAYFFLVSYGVVIILASLNVKAWRVDRIYTSDQLMVQVITDRQLTALFCGYLAINTILFVTWVKTSPNGFVQSTEMDRVSVVNCSVGNTTSLSVCMVYIMLLATANVVLVNRAVKNKIPKRFSEPWTLSIHSLGIVLVCAILLSMLLTLPNEVQRSLAKGYSMLVLVVITTLGHLGARICSKPDDVQRNATLGESVVSPTRPLDNPEQTVQTGGVDVITTRNAWSN